MSYIPKGNQIAWAQYTIRAPNRSGEQNSLKKVEIPALIYPLPLNRQLEVADERGNRPLVDHTAGQVLSPPISLNLAEKLRPRTTPCW